MLQTWFKLVRYKQWIKNFFVFVPFIFSLKFVAIQAVWLSFQTFVGFCLVSSGVYILNDIIDLRKDQEHPIKQYRPLASQQITLSDAIIVSFLISSSGLILLRLAEHDLLKVGLLYIMLNVAYSYILKHIAIIDVLFIATGFILRVYAGAVAIGVHASPFLLSTTFFIALSLGFGKRKRELWITKSSCNHNTRPVLGQYSIYFLDQLITITVTLTILSYSLYTISPETIERFGTDKMVFTTVFVIYGLFRYIFLLNNETPTDDSVESVLYDKGIIISCALYTITLITLIYRS
jgi:4-hydroxybenzoate polyprenyltransferase